ncbi:MAG: tetratricopeptide repeat protein [Candidatus Nitronauta litoralis]|uniref:Tetratricopeptide repeat protein n=1 Tax=Candidatus Nitronauta litoralis TaxID=2705533 RepID=A0A7T0BU79_9BACT|nr:MAG: tetratricopeptide repeat protein [Candidatus Nitronauta litoralis]
MGFFDFLHQSSLTEYENRVTRDPNDAEAHFLIGVGFERRGDVERAISAFEEVVRINPRSAEAHFNLAHLFAFKNEGSQAIRHITQAGNLFSQRNETEKKDQARSLLREFHARFKDVEIKNTQTNEDSG